MSGFNATANSQAYSVATENELSEVLSHYNSEFVFSVVDMAMKKRFEELPLSTVPNAVSAWEQNFKTIISIYGDSSITEVYRVRDETYREIIDTICKEFGLNFTIDDSIDLYSAAYYLYDLFVCGFSKYMTTFFANYIYKERSSIYESLNLADLKKNKDSSTIYGRKVFKDTKLAIINAHIDMVISQIAATELPFYTVISTIFGANSELTKYYLTIISADNDFFNRTYLAVLNSDIKPDVITSIRFKLQEYAMNNDQISNSGSAEVE